MPITSIIGIILGFAAIALVAYEVRYSYMLERYEYQIKHTLDLEAELMHVRHELDKHEAANKTAKKTD